MNCVDYENGGIDANAVAKNLGLTVLYRSIRKDKSVAGQLYFQDTDALLYNEQTGAEETVHINGRTIIVDPSLQAGHHRGAEKNTIIHECIHWALHRKAFEFERLYNQALITIDELAEYSSVFQSGS